MRIKVDENIGASGVKLLREGGHDVITVREQGLAGSADERAFQACVAEGRTLVTLDRDFGQTVTSGMCQASRQGKRQAVWRPSLASALHDRLRDFLALAARRSVNGELWIVEPGRVRVRLEKDEE